jgi:hypothetical protein
MKIVAIHLHLAFEDCQCTKQTADYVADALREFCFDKFDAEVVDTPVVKEQTVEVPDFSATENWDVLPPAGEPDPIEVWQARAREALQKL